jgi:chemotaxis family two-component system response regulator PixG
MLFNELQKSTQLKYNGRFKVRSSQGNQWIFYYRLGQIVWATGGTHPHRRWRRNLAQNCPQINIDQFQFPSAVDLSIDCWDYRLLDILYKQKKFQRQQIDMIVANTIAELLFDLVQQSNFTSLSFERNSAAILEAPICSTSTNIFLKQMQTSWYDWSEAGLADFSPYLAPVLRKPEILQQQVSLNVYKNLENLINGKYTLWDLAVKMKQNICLVTRSLLPYIHQGVIELIPISDLPLPVAKVNNHYTVTQPKNRYAPLIACVDDSPQIGEMLGKIMTGNGLGFLNIQDSVQALPILMQSKPDLIFLDLLMPVINGYELCAQLRRSSILMNTPVVILTGSDGMFDQVRSKVFGATDFVTKPVETDKVMGIVNKYLRTTSAVENVYNFAFSY